MGFDILLEDERGKKVDGVGDPSSLLQSLLPSPKDESFACLRFVDPYGDTTFNRAQVRALIVELERIRAKAATGAEQELLDGIKRLAERCQAEAHLYIRFYGD